MAAKAKKPQNKKGKKSAKKIPRARKQYKRQKETCLVLPYLTPEILLDKKVKAKRDIVMIDCCNPKNEMIIPKNSRGIVTKVSGEITVVWDDFLKTLTFFTLNDFQEQNPCIEYIE